MEKSDFVYNRIAQKIEASQPFPVSSYMMTALLAVLAIVLVLPLVTDIIKAIYAVFILAVAAGSPYLVSYIFGGKVLALELIQNKVGFDSKVVDKMTNESIEELLTQVNKIYKETHKIGTYKKMAEQAVKLIK